MGQQVLSSIYWKYEQYDPAKSGLLVYTWQVGELPLGFEHFGYQADSMIYLDIVQRIYKYGFLGYWLDPNITGSWGNFRYYMVVILCRPLAHVVNLILYGLWSDEYALLIFPALAGILGPIVMYFISRRLGYSKISSVIAALFLLTNKYFLFEAGEALFDTPSIFVGLVALYFWIRHKQEPCPFWVTLTQTAAILYRQSNTILFVACLAYDYLENRLKNQSWYKIPLIITLIMIPMYIFHLIGGWTFFTPGLIEVEYHGSILTKPMYFISTWWIAFGLFGLLGILGVTQWVIQKNKTQTIEDIMPIYLLLIWIFNFAWAINMGRFWMIAAPPVIFMALRQTKNYGWSLLAGLFILVSLFEPSYSIIAKLISGGGI